MHWKLTVWLDRFQFESCTYSYSGSIPEFLHGNPHSDTPNTLRCLNRVALLPYLRKMAAPPALRIWSKALYQNGYPTYSDP